MRNAEFRGLLESLNGLTPRQRETLLSALEQGQEEEDVREVVAELFEDGVQCPHCRAKHVIRWGQTSGLPRWRCKECRRTFSPLTGTPLVTLSAGRSLFRLSDLVALSDLIAGLAGEARREPTGRVPPGGVK